MFCLIQLPCQNMLQGKDLDLIEAANESRVVINVIVTRRSGFLRLRHHQVQVQANVHQVQQNGRGIPLNIARYQKTVSAALWIQITLVACYLPEALLRSLSSVYSINEVTFSISRRYTVSLTYLNSTLNPFLYCWKIREVRQAVKDTLTQYCCSSS